RWWIVMRAGDLVTIHHDRAAPPQPEWLGVTAVDDREGDCDEHRGERYEDARLDELKRPLSRRGLVRDVLGVAVVGEAGEYVLCRVRAAVGHALGRHGAHR